MVYVYNYNRDGSFFEYGKIHFPYWIFVIALFLLLGLSSESIYYHDNNIKPPLLEKPMFTKPVAITLIVISILFLYFLFPRNHGFFSPYWLLNTIVYMSTAIFCILVCIVYGSIFISEVDGPNDPNDTIGKYKLGVILLTLPLFILPFVVLYFYNISKYLTKNNFKVTWKYLVHGSQLQDWSLFSRRRSRSGRSGPRPEPLGNNNSRRGRPRKSGGRVVSFKPRPSKPRGGGRPRGSGNKRSSSTRSVVNPNSITSEQLEKSNLLGNIFDLWNNNDDDSDDGESVYIEDEESERPESIRSRTSSVSTAPSTTDPRGGLFVPDNVRESTGRMRGPFGWRPSSRQRKSGGNVLGRADVGRYANEGGVDRKSMRTIMKNLNLKRGKKGLDATRAGGKKVQSLKRRLNMPIGGGRNSKKKGGVKPLEQPLYAYPDFDATFADDDNGSVEFYDDDENEEEEE